ncbi:hypothetical protein [Arcicella lustrica]|uniref:RES domain-containing protein n=1 Tax=Arcicella lustrica TaxID=2984196 RepID=A0ABU5SPQ0_9BACT|nr:hypothetical protein [Arcicella sp. DC25W]MEA5429237.1 hypothetical protein [Arcicella sp. DC25W]
MTTIAENKTIADEINRCLTGHKLTYKPTFDFNDFMTTENIITNLLATNKLTDLILKNYFQQNPIGEYHHFTDLAAFESILTNKKLWLFSVKKRFGENEFKPFYKAHHMDGYELRQNSSGVPMENELVENAFYASFTNDRLSTDAETYMWDYFAKKTGVRLVFEVNEVNTDFRQIYYPDKATRTDISLLTDLIDIATRRNKYLIIERIATIGFFYLPCDYKIEQEYRLLVKRETGNDFGMKFGTKDGHEYMEFPFNTSNPLAQFKLKKVIFDTGTDIMKAEQIIASSEFVSIPTEKNNR